MGAEQRGIRKAHIADASIHKIYILQLSSYHRICLGMAYSFAIQQLGLSATRAAVVDKMVSIFNSWHTVALQNGDPRRFGGYISRHLVEQYLTEQGRTAVASQVHQRICQPATRQPTLTDDQIEDLNRPKARDWCRTLGLKVEGTKEELRLRLKEHFKKVAF